MITNSARRGIAPPIVVLAAVLLAACGGDGGDTPATSTTPTTPTTVTITCPNGTQQTAATTDVAQALCPAPKVLTVIPSEGTSSVPVNGFAGVVVSTDSALDVATLTPQNVMLKIGSLTAIPGTVSAANTKGFMFVPATQLSYGQKYSFSFSGVKDSLGRALDMATTFTTASVECTAPQVPNAAGTACDTPPATPVACTAPAKANSLGTCISPPAPVGYSWNDIMKAWVADVGVLVSGARALPPACATNGKIGDPCWKESVASGLIQFVNSGVHPTELNNRPIVFAFYSSQFPTGPTTTVKVYNVTPMYADAEASSPAASVAVFDSGNFDTITDVKGSLIGAKQNTSGGCYERYWSGSGFGNLAISCPI